MKVMLVCNPRSGRRQAPEVRHRAEELAAAAGIALHVRMIEGPGHGTVLAQEGVEQGYDRVIGVGGDGTFNALAAGLMGSKVALGLVPMGSGNGYARSVGVPLKPEAALHRALTGPIRRMDMGYLNDRPFLGVAGIGFDAQVAHRFAESRGRGLWNYVRITLEEMADAAAMSVQVRANGLDLREEVLMVVCCNTREFGNGAVISPNSRPNDGQAELLLVRRPGWLPMIGAMAKLFTGGLQESRLVHLLTTTQARIVQPGTWAHVDGEPFTVGPTVEFRLESGCLWVAA
jgi:diacylglycerol kinase (ATP)